MNCGEIRKTPGLPAGAGLQTHGLTSPAREGGGKNRFSRKPARHDGERGFALLLVFVMAAAVALMLYQQMPRVAFETERDKEQLLISRGEQYKRAIQMYVVAYKKYPSKIEDLENTNNHRYLRKRFIDPMTGKDEWRIIHVNGAGQLTDSVVTKPPTPDGKSGDPNAANASGASGATGADAPQEVNAAVRQRPSDRTLPNAGFQGGGGQVQPVDPDDPRYWPAITLLPSGASGTSGAHPPQFPGQQFPGQQFPGQQLPPGQQPIPGQQPMPVQQLPGQQLPGLPGTIPPGFQPLPPGQLPPQPNPTVQPLGAQNPQQTPFPPGLSGPGGNPPGGVIQPPPGAIEQINQQLTSPRSTPNIQQQNNTIGGGMAGVASTYTGPSIKVYKDRQKYNEWEFIFDLKSGLPAQSTGVQGGRGPQQPPNLPPGMQSFGPGQTRQQ